jgi:hypothetical protein
VILLFVSKTTLFETTNTGLKMIKFILWIFITLGLMFGLKASINACTGTLNLNALALEAETVFIGKAVKVENVKLAMVGLVGNAPSNLVLFTPKVQKLSFEVSELIKGKTSNTLEVLFQPSSCFRKFTNKESGSWIVFAYKWSPLLSNDESLLSEENRLKKKKLKAEADNFNQGLPVLEVFAVPLSSIEEDKLETIKNIAKNSKK